MTLPSYVFPFLSKVIENTANEEPFTNLPIKQFGFGPNHSCTAASADATIQVLDTKVIILIQFDSSKVFDMLNNKILSTIFRFIGTHVKTLI